MPRKVLLLLLLLLTLCLHFPEFGDCTALHYSDNYTFVEREEEEYQYEEVEASSSYSVLEEDRLLRIRPTLCNLTRFPFVAAIYNSVKGRGTKLCAGVLISDVWVITAASCFSHVGIALNITEIRVTVGLIHLGPLNSDNLQVATVGYRHERYVRRLKFDIGLLRLSRPVELSEFVGVAKLPPSPGWIQKNCPNHAFMMGWGDLEDPPHEVVPGRVQYLHCTRVRLTKSTWCKVTKQWSTRVLTNLDHTLLYSKMLPNANKCRGDRGGPLVCKGVVIGILVNADDCVKPDYCTIFTNLECYNNFINKITNISVPFPSEPHDKMCAIKDKPKSHEDTISALMSMYLLPILSFIFT